MFLMLIVDSDIDVVDVVNFVVALMLVLMLIFVNNVVLML